jgi:hypothetical protein
MSELFSHLLQRHQGAVPLVKPRRPSRFETKGMAFVAGANPHHGEEPRPVQAGEQFPVQTPAMTVSAAALSREESWKKRPEALPATGKEYQDPIAAGHPNITGADVALWARSKRSAAEALSFQEASRQQPREKLSRPLNKEGHGRPEADTNAVLRPAQALGEIHPRFTTLVTRSAVTPVEMPARPGQMQKTSRFSNHPDGPVNDPEQPDVETPVIQPPVTRTRPMDDPGRPVGATPLQDDPQPALPSSDTPAGAHTAVLGQAIATTGGQNGLRAGEHLLVPPDWLIRMQRDFQSVLEATARKAKTEPTINVTIGRVEVRAQAPLSPPKPKNREKASPVMSLDEYLSRRKGRG